MTSTEYAGFKQGEGGRVYLLNAHYMQGTMLSASHCLLRFSQKPYTSVILLSVSDRVGCRAQRI